jgi:formylglycine-generating enzyme required for sulfatase activity
MQNINKGRILRGGCWFNDSDYNLRSAVRFRDNPDIESNDSGFRCTLPAGLRVNRGGSWNYILNNCLRSANRNDNYPDTGYDNIGFRCIFTITGGMNYEVSKLR